MQPQQQDQPDAYQSIPHQSQPPASTDWQQPAAPIAADASATYQPVQPPQQPVQQPVPPVSAPVAPSPAPQPTETVQPVATNQPAPIPPTPMQENPMDMPQQNEFMTDDSEPEQDSGQEQNLGDEELIRWQASEHIHRQKTAVWYGTFAVVVVALIAVAIFVVNSITFAVLIPVMAIALAVYATHPPLMIDYTLSRKGLHVNDRLYDFDSFKEFGLIHGDDENSIMLVPRKRFQPGLTIYFPDEAGEAIVDMLAARLPMHEVRMDPIDRLIRRLHI